MPSDIPKFDGRRREAVEKRSSLLEVRKVPTEQEIEAWILNQINRIKLTNSVDASDEGLQEGVLCHERRVKDDG